MSETSKAPHYGEIVRGVNVWRQQFNHAREREGWWVGQKREVDITRNDTIKPSPSMNANVTWTTDQWGEVVNGYVSLHWKEPLSVRQVLKSSDLRASIYSSGKVGSRLRTVFSDSLETLFESVVRVDVLQVKELSLSLFGPRTCLCPSLVFAPGNNLKGSDISLSVGTKRFAFGFKQAFDANMQPCDYGAGLSVRSRRWLISMSIVEECSLLRGAAFLRLKKNNPEKKKEEDSDVWSGAFRQPKKDFAPGDGRGTFVGLFFSTPTGLSEVADAQSTNMGVGLIKWFRFPDWLTPAHDSGAGERVKAGKLMLSIDTERKLLGNFVYDVVFPEIGIKSRLGILTEVLVPAWLHADRRLDRNTALTWSLSYGDNEGHDSSIEIQRPTIPGFKFVGPV